MAIEKKLICFRKLEDFKTQLEAGNILDYSIVLIQDAKMIYNRGTYYNELVGLTGEELDRLFRREYPAGVFSFDFTYNNPEVSDYSMNYRWDDVGFTQEHFDGIVAGAYNNATGFTIAGTVYPYIHVGSIYDEGTENETYEIYSEDAHLFDTGGPNAEYYRYRIGMADWG